MTVFVSSTLPPANKESALYFSYDSNGSTILSLGVWADVPINMEVKKDADYFHDNLIDPTEVEILTTGKYLIFGHLEVTPINGNNSEFQSRIAVNTGAGYVGLDETICNSYSNFGGISVHAKSSTPYFFSAGDKVKLQALHSVGTTVYTTTANRSSLYLVKLTAGEKGDKGDPGVDGLPGAGSTINALEKGVAVPNTPFSNFNFTGNSASAKDAGGGTVDVEYFGKFQFTFSSTQAPTGNRFLGYGDGSATVISSESTPAVSKYPALLTSISYSNNFIDSDCDIEIYKNQLVTPDYVMQVRNKQFRTQSSKAGYLLFAKGDTISVFHRDQGNNSRGVNVQLSFDILDNSDGIVEG